jgi:hypothetical protein
MLFPRWRYILTLLLSLWGDARAQDLSALDRRLNVAVLGFSFDETAAKAALAAGANINHRNNGETMLIGAIKGFKEPAVIKFLISNGIDRSARDSSGKSALDIARKYNIGRTEEGRGVMAMLDPDSRASVPAAASRVAPTPPPAKPAPAAMQAPSPDADTAAPIRPGVYECMNQSAMVTPMAFGILDSSSYMASNGKRGQYKYDIASATLSLDPGTTPARYRRISATTFRLIREDGQLGGFTCPLNPSKNANRPPW